MKKLFSYATAIFTIATSFVLTALILQKPITIMLQATKLRYAQGGFLSDLYNTVVFILLICFYFAMIIGSIIAFVDCAKTIARCVVNRECIKSDSKDLVCIAAIILILILISFAVIYTRSFLCGFYLAMTFTLILCFEVGVQSLIILR